MAGAHLCMICRHYKPCLASPVGVVEGGRRIIAARKPEYDGVCSLYGRKVKENGTCKDWVSPSSVSKKKAK